MNVTVPIYIELSKEGYTVRPLFFPTPVQRHEKLERVLHLLARDLRRILHDLGKQARHDALAQYTFNPDLEYKRVDTVIELRRRVARVRYLFVHFETLGRRVAFTPALSEVWFELERGESLQDRASEVLTEYFRRREREADEDDFVTPESLELKGSAWITTLDLDVYPNQMLEEAEDSQLAALGDLSTVDGEAELFRVGRCLDQLYPDDLDRVLFREPQVEELTRLLTDPDCRPVLLLGPPQVGKTALLHEYVWRRVSTRRNPHKIRNYVWLLSPQRLISGMSYVGQWEHRLLAILKEARKREHILYFDDFLGLYFAGITSQSDLSVAHVLKPYVERREVRIVAEMTPEAFRVLRERDRGFADLFHVLPVPEPSDDENLRILIAVQRQLEGQHRTSFDLDVMPTVLDLHRRYVRPLSFPGKAAAFLRRLAVKHRHGTVTRQAALEEFKAQSGLVLTMLDTRVKLDRQSVIAALEQQVIGQPTALSAAADVISIAKARLNDPERPLAAFLFLGPTGVGKTQCAKALATYLFGQADRLIRFDMNEFLEPGSAARLVGTFYSPEGLLTAAIRRQPFAVVLLDEIEKAHPEVFDLLLQVLGEGRLTDALGRTADFSNALIILTSNLGVREAAAGLGFQRSREEEKQIQVQAAEKFFRPEFFNRLDRVVPFERLRREDVSGIARLLMRDLFQREGLVRRKCVLRVDDEALERIVDQGFDPILGARALKRALERQLTQPVAERLAAGLPETMTVISVYPNREGGLLVDVRGLVEIERSPLVELPPRELPDALERCRSALNRLEKGYASLRPRGEITAASLDKEHLTYFTLHDLAQQIRDSLRRIAEDIEGRRRAALGLSSLVTSNLPRAGKPMVAKLGVGEGLGKNPILTQMAAAQDLVQFIEELSNQATPLAESESELSRAALLMGELELAAGSLQRGDPTEVVLHGWCDQKSPWVHSLACEYFRMYRLLGLDVEVLECPQRPGQVERDRKTLALEGEDEIDSCMDDWGEFAFCVRGLSAWTLTRLEAGSHLFIPSRESLVLVLVHAWPVSPGQRPQELLTEKNYQRQQWRERLGRGEDVVDNDPYPLAPVIRIYGESGGTLDLRTGLSHKGYFHLIPFVRQSLPLPAELLHEGSEVRKEV